MAWAQGGIGPKPVRRRCAGLCRAHGAAARWDSVGAVIDRHQTSDFRLRSIRGSVGCVYGLCKGIRYVTSGSFRCIELWFPHTSLHKTGTGAGRGLGYMVWRRCHVCLASVGTRTEKRSPARKRACASRWGKLGVRSWQSRSMLCSLDPGLQINAALVSTSTTRTLVCFGRERIRDKVYFDDCRSRFREIVQLVNLPGAQTGGHKFHVMPNRIVMSYTTSMDGHFRVC